MNGTAMIYTEFEISLLLDIAKDRLRVQNFIAVGFSQRIKMERLNGFSLKISFQKQITCTFCFYLSAFTFMLSPFASKT
jgi:hypothetical protein